jgi:hypothetical protein
MSLCKTNVPLTDSDLQAVYGTMENPGILTGEMMSQAVRDEDGSLTKQSAQQVVKNYISQGRVPTAPKSADPTSLQKHGKKEDNFVQSIHREYCFYDIRYKYALQQLIEHLKTGMNPNDSANSQAIKFYLTSTKALNQRLNDIITLTKEIAEQRGDALYPGMKSMNSDFSSRVAKLEEQRRILRSQQGDVKLYKEMVAYTREKAKYTNNLLNLYSFLNVFAIGMLVYLYRSMD